MSAIPDSVISPEAIGLDAATLKRFASAEKKNRGFLADIADHEEDQVEAAYSSRVAKLAKAIGAGSGKPEPVSREVIRGEFVARREAIARAMMELKLTLLPDLERLATRTSERLLEWADQRQKAFAAELRQWGVEHDAVIPWQQYRDGGLMKQSGSGFTSVSEPRSALPIVNLARDYAKSVAGSTKGLCSEWRANMDRGVTPDAALALATSWTLRDLNGPTVAEALSESFGPIGLALA